MSLIPSQSHQHHQQSHNTYGPAQRADIFDAQHIHRQIDDARDDPDCGADAAGVLGGNQAQIHGHKGHKVFNIIVKGARGAANGQGFWGDCDHL